MKSLDTNVLVRFLVRDDQEQADKVYELFKQTEVEKGTLHISNLVILELMWVLESAYQIERNDIISSLDKLILIPLFSFENHSALQGFLIDAPGSSYDLSDLLIAHTAKSCDADVVLTFDKKASRHPLFEMLK